MSESKSSSGGVGFFGLLAIAFIVLKLCNVITWSWWWVTCPLWGELAIFLLVLPFVSIYRVLKNRDERKRNEAGYNLHSWDNGGRSKWQQMEEMRKKQKADVN